MVVCAFNLSTLEVEMGVQGHGQLCSEFEASWLYETLYQRKKKDRQTEKKSHKRE